jgi:hypothetical protein
MVLEYTGETENIDDQECFLFALGTNQGDEFVTETYYAVYGEVMYRYDEENDAWSLLMP